MNVLSTCWPHSVPMGVEIIGGRLSVQDRLTGGEAPALGGSQELVTVAADHRDLIAVATPSTPSAGRRKVQKFVLRKQVAERT